MHEANSRIMHKGISSRCLLTRLLTSAVLLFGAVTLARGQSDPPTPVMCTAQCPNGNWVPVHCSGAPEYNSECGIGSSSNSSNSNTSSSSSNQNAYAPLSGAALRQQMNQQLRTGVTNAAMQGFMQGFLNSMAKNSAAAQQQQQALQQEILRQQLEAEQQRRLAEQQRLDAMFARLNNELKLEGLPFNLSLKGMSAGNPGDLQLKGISSTGPDDLKLKVGDASATSYGLKGLTGIYVGGPAGGDGSATGSVTANGDSSSSSPNWASGPGIAGLPGINLDGVQPSQAPQLAQAAQTMSGPEKAIAEDTALEAAQNNPSLMSPSQDPQVQNFQQADQSYQQASVADTAAKQNYEVAQARAQADQTEVEVAQKQLDSITPSVQQQAAFDQMLGAAQSDEQASMLARQNFDSTEIHLSVSRDRAAVALAQTTSAVDLRGTSSTTVASLKTPSPGDTHILPTAVVSLPKARPISSPAPVPTQAQLRARLDGMQESLRRLMEDESKRGKARKDAEKDIDDSVKEAQVNGIDMLSDLFLTGWDHCAPGVQGGVKGFFERHLDHVNEELRDLYKDASVAKPDANLGEFNEQWNALDRRKLWLENSIGRIKNYDQFLTNLHAGNDLKEIREKADGSIEGSLEGLGKVIGMGMDDDNIRTFLGLSECGAVTVKAASSVIDSVYDIFKEGDAAESLRQTDENTTQFLTAQKSLQRQIKRTVAQLNCYKISDASGVVACMNKLAQP